MSFNKFKQFKPLISRDQDETHHFKYNKFIAFALCCVETSVVKTLDLTTHDCISFDMVRIWIYFLLGNNLVNTTILK